MAPPRPLRFLVSFVWVVCFAGCMGMVGSMAPAETSDANALPADDGGSNATRGEDAGGTDAGRVMDSGAPYDAGEATPFDGGCAVKRGPADTSQTPGTWKNVTPSGLNLSDGIGAGSVVVDPARPSDVYLGTDKHGIFKSTDYGATWQKINTGTNGNMIDAGPIWSMAIDPNPCRDPATPATLYAVVIFNGGLWKSLDGGKNWARIWDKNITAADGTPIWGDVGGDVGSVRTPDPADSNHLIVIMHGYSGPLGNTGIYESRDAGATWVLRKSTKFSFQAHNDIFGIIDSKTWLVSPGTISTGTHLFRTTVGGEPWADVGVAPAKNLGYILAFAGSTIYTGTDFVSGVWQTTDRAATWQPVPNAGGHGQVSWVVATGTKIYAASGLTVSLTGHPGQVTIERMDIGSSAPWVSESPAGMTDNGHLAAATFDGTHHVIIGAQHLAGFWRYVEP
jgi:hypothetical protein